MVSMLDFRSNSLWFETWSRLLCCFLKEVSLLHIVSLHPGVKIGTSNKLLQWWMQGYNLTISAHKVSIACPAFTETCARLYFLSRNGDNLACNLVLLHYNMQHGGGGGGEGRSNLPQKKFQYCFLNQSLDPSVKNSWICLRTGHFKHVKAWLIP